MSLFINPNTNYVPWCDRASYGCNGSHWAALAGNMPMLRFLDRMWSFPTTPVVAVEATAIGGGDNGDEEEDGGGVAVAKTFGTVAALQDKTIASSRIGQLALQLVDFPGRDERWKFREAFQDSRNFRLVFVNGLLLSKA